MFACEGKVGLNHHCKAYSYVVEQECLISKFTPMYFLHVRKLCIYDEIMVRNAFNLCASYDVYDVKL